jgi:hypothetical protein
MMKALSPRAHGLIDYLWAAAVPTLPRLMGWSPQVTRLLTAAGMGGLVYSLVTDYELGMLRLLPMKGHLAFDYASAALLGTAPFWLDEEPEVNAALVGLGLFALVVALNTGTSRQTSWRDARRVPADWE